jgi:hypothetical protein
MNPFNKQPSRPSTLIVSYYQPSNEVLSIKALLSTFEDLQYTNKEVAADMLRVIASTCERMAKASNTFDRGETVVDVPTKNSNGKQDGDNTVR